MLQHTHQDGQAVVLVGKHVTQVNRPVDATNQLVAICICLMALVVFNHSHAQMFVIWASVAVQVLLD